MNDIELAILVAALTYYIEERPKEHANYAMAQVIRDTLDRRDTR